MMYKSKIFLLTIFCLFIITICLKKKDSTISAHFEENPVWIDFMDNQELKIDVARASFDEYWTNHVHFQGDRSKQFERWYERNSKRLDSYGNIIPASKVYEEYQHIRSASFFEQSGKWFNYGPLNVGARNNGDRRDGGRVKHISFHPSDTTTYYVSCFKSGFFKTVDGGLSWVPLTDQLPLQVFISSVVDNPTEIIFIGTDMGIKMSNNGGETWMDTGLSSGRTNALLIHPENKNIIIAGNESGIYYSEDSGGRFVQVQEANKVEELIMHPTNPDIIYAGTNGANSQYFRSEDGGRTWTDLTTEFGEGAFIKIAVTPAQPEYVYVINSRDHLGEDSFDGVYRSTDTGLTFTKMSGSLPCITGYDSATGSISRGQPNYNLFIVADPNNPNTLYAGGVKSWKSIDAGISWTQSFDEVTTLGFGLHLDQLSWAYSPLTEQLFAVNDGGIYFLNNEDKFQPITDGLPIAEVWECTQSQINPYNVAGGTFHCGVKLNRDGSWYSPWGGDEATCLFDYTDDQYVYHFKYDKISRSNDGGFTFQRINPDPSDRGFYTGTGVLDKSDVSILYAGLIEVERTINAREPSAQSVVWSKISSFGGSQRITKIEQSDADHNTLYVSREGNKFYRTDNLKENQIIFTDITENLPISGSVTDIATHPSEPNFVYILLGSKIYKSEDKGKSWTDISIGLPEVALLEVVYDRSSNEGIYIGTDIGVYYRDLDLDSWIDYSDGLPAIRVSGMDIYYGGDRQESFLTISTDGRGFWRSQLYGVSDLPPKVEFIADKTETFAGDEIGFTDLSNNVQVGSYRWEFKGGEPSFSLDKNPRITYNQVGRFPVSLSYTTAVGTTTKLVESYINIKALSMPIADFSVSETILQQGNFIQFFDISENQPTSWLWTFTGGNPDQSSDKNPIVQYEIEGTYSVSLTTTNAAGTDFELKENFITVVPGLGSGDLQAYFTFDANLKDSSSYKRDLFIEGDFQPNFTIDPTGKNDKAFDGPGSPNQYLFSGYKGIGGNSERTVTTWFKTSNAGTRKTIVSWGVNQEGKMFNVMIHNGKIRIEGGSCNLQTKKSGLDDDQWHHLAVVYNPDSGPKMKDLKIYIDGLIDENETDTGASFRSEEVEINTDNGVSNLRIGSSEYNNNYFWRGSIDDVQIYSKALIASEISDIFFNNTTSSELSSKSQSIYSIWPNPVTDKLIVKSDNNISGTLCIFDLSGKLVFIKKITKGSNKLNLDLSNLSTGLYLLAIDNNSDKVIFKFVKK